MSEDSALDTYIRPQVAMTPQVAIDFRGVECHQWFHLTDRPMTINVVANNVVGLEIRSLRAGREYEGRRYQYAFQVIARSRGAWAFATAMLDEIALEVWVEAIDQVLAVYEDDYE